MVKRIELHNKLKTILPNVYFQPPSNVRLTYPCIVYHKSPPEVKMANDTIYNRTQEYQLTIIDQNPDSDTADRILGMFPYCTIGSYSIVDNLNHTTLNLYY